MNKRELSIRGIEVLSMIYIYVQLSQKHSNWTVTIIEL